ncbi:tetratricopeptide repeat protein 9C-like isoform X2 [Panulirus ornatus]
MDLLGGGVSHVMEEGVLQKLTKAKEFKQKGNEHFKQQQLKKAIQSYHSGLMYMKGIHQDMNPNKLLGQGQSTPCLPQEVKDEVNVLSADLHNNIAACLLKQKPVRYERVIECCKLVTESQPDNMKGWYRLGLAHFHLRDHDAAREALKEANRIASGQDMAVRKLLACVDQELKKENKKFSDMFRNSLLAKET